MRAECAPRSEPWETNKMTQTQTNTFDSTAPSHSDLKLARLTQACRTGDMAGAQMELHDWAAESDCPTAARVLLAALHAREGDHAAACRVLDPAIQTPLEKSDPAAIRLTLAVLIDAGLQEDARDIAIQAQKTMRHNHPLIAWMVVMAVPGFQDHNFDTLSCDPMASAIADAPETVPSIVRACQVKPTPNVISVLRRAIGQIVDLPRLQDIQSELCTAMAELALLADDKINARLWAKRGLSLSPFSAQLAIALDEATEAQRTRHGDEAIDVLARVHTEHPEYPDLAAALIRRENSQGLTDSAQHRLALWLEEKPNQPIARRLQKEMAA